MRGRFVIGSVLLAQGEDIREAHHEDDEKLHHDNGRAEVELDEVEDHLVGIERKALRGCHRAAIGQVETLIAKGEDTRQMYFDLKPFADLMTAEGYTPADIRPESIGS